MDDKIDQHAEVAAALIWKSLSNGSPAYNKFRKEIKMDAVVAFEIERNLYDKFKTACEINGSKFGDELRNFIKDYVAKHDAPIQKWEDQEPSNGDVKVRKAKAYAEQTPPPNELFSASPFYKKDFDTQHGCWYIKVLRCVNSYSAFPFWRYEYLQEIPGDGIRLRQTVRNNESATKYSLDEAEEKLKQLLSEMGG